MESRNQEIINENNITVGESESLADDVISEEYEATPKKKRSFNPFRSAIFTKPFFALFLVLCASAVIYLISRLWSDFAELWTRYPAQGIRFVLAKITDYIPFSFAEAVIVALPVIIIAYITASSISISRSNTDGNFYKWIRPVLSVAMVISILFFVGFGTAYNRTPLSENLGIVQSPVSAQELFSTGVRVALLANEELDEVAFDHEGASVMPYSFGELTDKINEAYEKFTKERNFISHFGSNPKAIALSEPMTYTHISGVYTYMTGEANINTNYPDFIKPFTVAHEMAHQRGIAREDEANFVAFLVCIGSDDDYIRYSGYANMLNYLNSALSQANRELAKQLIAGEPTAIKQEFSAYSVFFDKYRDSTASTVTGAVNNTFLQSQGQSAGTKSYGLVVDLAVAYYKQ